MERKSAALALARAVASVMRGDVLLLRQKDRIAAAELAGRDTARFKDLLSVLEDSQRSHIIARDRLREICNANRT
jgi:hypothetical protein